MVDFDWQNFQFVAQKVRDLADNASPEEQVALLRTAVSRAYYYAYHSAYNRLLNDENPWILFNHGVVKKDVTTQDYAAALLDMSRAAATNQFEKKVGSLHTYVAKQFQIGPRRNIGLDLNELKSDRHEADYDPSAAVTAAWADQALKKAASTVVAIQKLPTKTK
jgi:uncharacterized protein (UPF0332 family)